MYASSLEPRAVRRGIVLILVLFVVTTFVWRGVPERWSGGELPAYYAAVPQSDAERQAGIEYVLPKWSVTVPDAACTPGLRSAAGRAVKFSVMSRFSFRC